MTVQCPRCRTQYRVPDSRPTGENPVFKCTRCENVFAPGEERKTSRRKKKEAVADPPNLSFAFGQQGDEAKDGSAAQRAAAGDNSEEPAFVGELDDPAAEAGFGDDHTSLPDESWDEGLETDDESLEEEAEYEDDAEEEDDLRGLHDEDEDWDTEPKQRSSRRPKKAAVRPRGRRERGDATPGRAHRSPLRPVGGAVALLNAFVDPALNFGLNPSSCPWADFEWLGKIPGFHKIVNATPFVAGQRFDFRQADESVSVGFGLHSKSFRKGFEIVRRKSDAMELS